MENVDYKNTVASFNFGVKNPRAAFIIAIIATFLMVVICACVMCYYLFSIKDGHQRENIAGAGFCCAVFSALFLVSVIAFLYEHITVRKGIQRCINAKDAKLLTVVPFEFSSGYGGIFKSVSKLGVKFNFHGKRITMTMKRYAYIKRYIGVQTDIVYSPSCNDVVLLNGIRGNKALGR